MTIRKPFGVSIFLWGIFFLALIFAAGSFKAGIGKVFTLDETDIAGRAHMIVAEGPNGPLSYFGRSSGEAMPHPPLCEYVFALVFKIFGETEVVGRAVGIVCYLLGALFGAGILKVLLSERTPDERRSAVVLFLTLFFLNPLLVQHAMLLDADSTLTFVFVNLFILCAIVWEVKGSRNFIASRCLLAVIWALMLLSKEGTPFLVMTGFLIYRALARQRKKLFIELFVVFIGGLLLAALLWVVFCKVYGIDPMIFLRQLYGWRLQKMHGAALFWRILNGVPMITRWPLFWVSFPFWVLVGIGFLKRVVDFIKTRKASPVDLLFTVGLAVWWPYFFVKPSIDMMKYQMPAYPLFLIAGVWAIVETKVLDVINTPKQRAALFAAGLAALIGFYYYRQLGDYILYLFDPSDQERWRSFFFRYFIPILVAYAVMAVYARLRKKAVDKALLVTSLILIFPIQASLNAAQAAATYTTTLSWLNYGEEGLGECIDYLAQVVKPGQGLSARKDIRYYMKLRRKMDFEIKEEPGYFFWPDNLKAFYREALAGRYADYLIFDPVSLSSNPKQGIAVGQGLVGTLYRVDRRIGRFMILKARRNG